MLDERPVTVIDELDPLTRTLNLEGIEYLISDKVDYLIADNLFQESFDILNGSRQEAEAVASRDGIMKDAGYGRGSEYSMDKKVRGDKFIWLSNLLEEPGSESIFKLASKLNEIKDMINEQLRSNSMEDETLDDREI